jgi:tRNA-specific 2-thiouridylase
MNAGATVIVGMSGGVDSAVAALLLGEAGYDVQGLHMTNWDEDEEFCTAAADWQTARAVCAELGIPLHRANFTAAYRAQVFSHFLADYSAGLTPNPDVLCNRHIKFGAFRDWARRLGARYIATGHYARGGATADGRLFLAADAGKDQTYFLHAVEPGAFADTLFPLGDLGKEEVRARAQAAGLPNHDRPDSTGICFIGEQPFRQFLERYLRGAAGTVLDIDGREVGRHEGLMHYTIGQRSGIGIGGLSASSGEPWYVVAKDAATNTLRVAQGREHPSLWSDRLMTGPPSWIRPLRSTELAGDLRARIRHRQPLAPCRVTARAAGLDLRFAEPQWAIAPGQYAVIYAGDECLGGGVISNHPL